MSYDYIYSIYNPHKLLTNIRMTFPSNYHRSCETVQVNLQGSVMHNNAILQFCATVNLVQQQETAFPVV